ncbi:glycosyltransferase [Marinoscillum furvescens]|uniref:Glycosyl transferase family 2 n=1 Tax=Marinoscillum furvescens DSM 4134 TaxID=1122208 RepID=A0A3D9L6P8_MARFU|nr:glycosyltransferase [Marinoscillum furvescens]REE01028.1 glycosyl transferase family 2 [Marinoscillum furvescens DSM 4134]
MESLPLVSVICLCHNQNKYVADAIRSVGAQTYQNIELIVVDDGSTDDSKATIRKLLEGTEVPFIDLSDNLGNCAAFNKGLEKSRGDFIIDLAADDMLLPKRVETGINDFANATEHAGVHFSDAFICDESGAIRTTHYPRNTDGQLTTPIPQGDIFTEVIKRYFICPPTMMMKREVFAALNGYDDTLSYEDFDFWVRSARQFHYIFNPAPLTKKRTVSGSHSNAQFAFRNQHQKSTFRVCQKALNLCTAEDERQALRKRIQYEIRQCTRTLNFGLIPKYVKLMNASYRRLSSSSSMER